MIRASVRWLVLLSWLAGAMACDGGEVVVFAVAAAGSAGESGSAGSANPPLAGAGSGASVGGSLEPAGGSGGTASGAGGGGGDTVDKPCQTTDDCDRAWLCQKQACSDAAGVCLPRPVSDDPVRAPVCGCDHITYFNDTLRQQYGISASTNGECRSGARTCINSDDCGPDGSCSHRLPNFNACSMPGTGQCWITPNDCASTSDKPRFLPCPPPGGMPGGPPPMCLTTCQALQSGYPYLPMPQNYVCP